MSGLLKLKMKVKGMKLKRSKSIFDIGKDFLNLKDEIIR